MISPLMINNKTTSGHHTEVATSGRNVPRASTIMFVRQFARVYVDLGEQVASSIIVN